MMNKKAEFLAELKKAVGLDAWITVMQKFGVSLTDEEIQMLQGGGEAMNFPTMIWMWYPVAATAPWKAANIYLAAPGKLRGFRQKIMYSPMNISTWYPVLAMFARRCRDCCVSTVPSGF